MQDHERQIQQLTDYRANQKMQTQSATSVPVPEQKPDPLLIAQTQIAQSYWEWAQALKTSQD